MPKWTLKVLTFKVCVSIRCTICVVLQCSAMILVMQRFRVVYRRISHGYTKKKGCITVSYHAIENTDGKGWVWYSWTARIDGEVRWNTDEYTTASFPAFWLVVFSTAWYKMQHALLITVDFVLFLSIFSFMDNRTTRVLPMSNGVKWCEVYSCFDKGCPTKALKRTRQCRLVLWVERVWRWLIEVHGVYQQEKRRHK